MPLAEPWLISPPAPSIFLLLGAGGVGPELRAGVGGGPRNSAEPAPLVALISGGDAPNRGRWSILAPVGLHPTIDSLEAVRANLARDPVADSATDPDAPPFSGGLIGFISYELGSVLEPAAKAHRQPRPPRTPAPWPLVQFHRCNAALVYDHLHHRWWCVGPEPLRTALASAAIASLSTPSAGSFVLGPLASQTGRATFERGVAQVVEYIRAGDIFQANLAHTLSGPFTGSPRRFFAALCAAAEPWYGAYLDVLPAGHASSPRRVICSASPELFLSYDPQTRRIVTRPMKGTVPVSAGEAALRDSEKDQAELNMIIDLMRSDIGRVSVPASVRVDDARAIELHGHAAARVYQGVATVSSTLAPKLDIVDLLGATFPAGSITGAPKIRAMQIIHDLEPRDRGPYCGAIGFISDSGHAAFSVAIRTALLTGRAPGTTQSASDHIDGACEYSVGAGIVADSVPALEWQETMTKARIISGLTQGIPE